MNEEKMDELLRLMRAVVPDTSDMSDAGRIGFVYRQNYDPEAQYEKLDVVKFGMSLWTPKAVTIGNSPPDQSQEGQENVEENEFWKMFLPGALGSDYVKKTDLSKPPTETEAGKPGINYPDGKTIQMDENGMLTGTPLDFSGTWDELFAGIGSGEVKDGMVGYVKGTKSDPDNPNHPNNLLLDFDDYLSLYSSNAPQNRIVTAMLNQIKALAEQNAQLIEDVKELRASVNSFGLAKVCPVSVTNVTEDNGMVLGGWEKNESVAGSLANRIANNRNALAKKQQFYTSLESIGITSTFIPDILAAMPSNSKFIAILNITGIGTNPNNKAPINVGIIEIEKAGGYSKTMLIQTDSGKSTGVLYQASVDTVNKIVRGWYKFSGTYIE